MVSKKPRIVIIGAGMAGLTAANKLYTSSSAKKSFELAVVEGGSRIGGRINTSSFCGDRIELGATWIHGIESSPVHKIADEIGSLHSDEPWECMDAISDSPVTAAEGGHLLSPSLVQPISLLFQNLMDFVQGKAESDSPDVGHSKCLSVGSFLRKGLEAHWTGSESDDNDPVAGNWTRKSLEEAVFAMHESIQRTFTSAGDLSSLDYNAERDYVMFPGEEITIAKGYSSVVESLAAVLPPGTIQLGRRVEKIEWIDDVGGGGNGYGDGPVTLHFSDGSVMSADHVVVTVSLGVLKRAVGSGFFSPALPSSKARAISRLGYGVVNKVFLKMSQDDQRVGHFPFLQMVFHPQDSEFRDPEIPNWIRRTSFLSPIYKDSRVTVSWFTGQEALELESLEEEEIISGFEKTVSNLLNSPEDELKFEKVLKSEWGSNPLFLGSYSYVAVGSSIDDMDTLAEPLPQDESAAPPLQVLFAGEATQKMHYSTTHGAYISGLREANRLLKHYSNFIGDNECC